MGSEDSVRILIMDKHHTVIIVGSGISGCMAAVFAADAGAEVVIASRDHPRRSASSALEGGINVADAHAGGDSADRHAGDTMKRAGAGADAEAVLRMCSAAPHIAGLLERMGVEFDREPDGAPSRVSLEGSSAKRAMEAGARTGLRVITALEGQVLRLVSEGKARMKTGFEFLSIVKDDAGRCCGAVICDRASQRVEALEGNAVVVCAADAVAGCTIGGAKAEGKGFPFRLAVGADHATNIAGLYAAGDAVAIYSGESSLPGNQMLSSAYGGMVAGRAAAAGAIASNASSVGSLLAAAARHEETVNSKLMSAEGEERAAKLAQALSGLRSASEVAALGDRFARAGLIDKGEWANREFFTMRAVRDAVEAARIICS